MKDSERPKIQAKTATPQKKLGRKRVERKKLEDGKKV